MKTLVKRIKDYYESHGLFPLFKKLTYSFTSYYLGVTLTLGAIPFVILSRILKPVLHIRFGHIRNDVIGHFVFDTEYYLTKKNLDNIKTLDLFYFHHKKMPNDYWPKMVKRSMAVYPLVKYADHANRLISGWQNHFVELNENSGRDVRNLLKRTKPQINFTDSELERGQIYLQECGMKPSDNYLCVICRDMSYKIEYQSLISSNWSHHNYRNSNISNYQKTINTLAQRDYFVFRMGKGVSNSIDESHLRVFDYANSDERSDFLDIFLFANSNFNIVSEAGILVLTHAFRRPFCFVNLAAIEYIQTWSNNSLVILKKYWLAEKNRFMTFKEIYLSGAGRFLTTEQYEKQGIELIENTPAEILDVSLEMHHRLNNTWETTEEDDELQNKFWRQFPKSELHGEIYARIGSQFLRENKNLLN